MTDEISAPDATEPKKHVRDPIKRFESPEPVDQHRQSGGTQPDASQGRNRSLDGLRGIAILLVVTSHANNPFVRFGGTAGVTLFFVLSGYLITSLLVDEQRRTCTISLHRFYARRARRLLPALILAIGGGVILAIAFGEAPGKTLTAAGLSLFYAGNLWPVLGVDLNPFGQLWSLALEEQYYLLWPILLLFLGRMRTGWLIGIVLALTCGSLAIRFGGPITTAAGYDRAYYLPQSSVWAILTGSVIALVLHYRPQLKLPIWTWHVGLVGLLFVTTVLGMRTGLHEEASGLTRVIRLAAGPLASVFSVLLVTNCAISGAPRAWLIHPVLLYFGGISYALYLWHGIIDHALGDTFGSTGLRGLAVGTISAVLAVGVATASGRWIEAPFMRTKARLERRWRQEAALSANASN
jgi:peptidoglycan/LPS O-acetylase OafA/YrhL